MIRACSSAWCVHVLANQTTSPRDDCVSCPRGLHTCLRISRMSSEPTLAHPDLLSLSSTGPWKGSYTPLSLQQAYLIGAHKNSSNK